MDSEQWIQSLARQARRETTPAIDVPGPRVRPATYRLPTLGLSISAVASLAAACLLLAMGLSSQQSSTSTTASSDQTNAVSVLFAPIDVEARQP